MNVKEESKVPVKAAAKAAKVGKIQSPGRRGSNKVHVPKLHSAMLKKGGTSSVGGSKEENKNAGQQDKKTNAVESKVAQKLAEQTITGIVNSDRDLKAFTTVEKAGNSAVAENISKISSGAPKAQKTPEIKQEPSQSKTGPLPGAAALQQAELLQRAAALGGNHQDAMIQRLLANQGGLGVQNPFGGVQLPSQATDRELLLRQLAVQEMTAGRQPDNISQLLAARNSVLGAGGLGSGGLGVSGLGGGGLGAGVLGASGLGTSGLGAGLRAPSNDLAGLALQQAHGLGGGLSWADLEQQLLVQRLRETELRNQLIAMEQGFGAQQPALQNSLGLHGLAGNSLLANRGLAGLQGNAQLTEAQQLQQVLAGSAPVAASQLPATANAQLAESELLAGMSVREKLQLLQQLNSQQR